MKKRIMTIALCLCLLAVAAMGTIAYFTDKEDVTNVFAIGDVDVKLTEAVVTYDADTWTWSATETRTEVGNTYEGKVYPGAVLPKDPTVENTGMNNAYIRAHVYFDLAFQTYIMDGITGQDRYETMQKYVETYIGDAYGEGWSLVSVEQGTNGDVADLSLVAEFAYKGYLAPGKTTAPIFTQVTIPSNFDNADFDWMNNVNVGGTDLVPGMRIDVNVDAIQAEGFADYAAAMAAFDAQQ